MLLLSARVLHITMEYMQVLKYFNNDDIFLMSQALIVAVTMKMLFVLQEQILCGGSGRAAVTWGTKGRGHGPQVDQISP